MDVMVTVEEHEQGWKVVPVKFRSGREFAVRLHAPRRGDARFAARGLAEGKDLVDLVALCRPRREVTAENAENAEKALKEDWVDRLDSASADLVETVALVLTFGRDFEKKIVDLAVARAEMDQATGTTRSAG